MDEDVYSLVVKAWSNDAEKIEAPIETDVIGRIGIWKGSFDRQCVGVQVTNDNLQLFRKVKKGYYKLSDLPETRSEWILQETVPESDYEYVEHQGHILLKLNK